MRRGAQAASYQPVASAPVVVRPKAIGSWLGARGQLPRIGVAAALAIGLGTLAVAVDATPELPGAQWLGSLDAAPVEGRTLRLLHLAAAGLGAEVRRVEAERDAQLQALHDQLRRRGEPQAARISTIAEIKQGAPSLHEEVKGLRLMAAGLLLREGARAGHPFEPALERFAMVAAAVRSPDLETDAVIERIAALRPYARTGVVSTQDLRRSFAPLTAMVDRAAALGWWDTALVTVGLRDDPLQPLQNARAALMVDDLAGAVDALATLQGEAALVTEGWLGLAQARLATDSAVDELYRLALAVGAEPFADGPVAAIGRPAPRGLPASAPWQAAVTTPAEGPWSR